MLTLSHLEHVIQRYRVQAPVALVVENIPDGSVVTRVFRATDRRFGVGQHPRPTSVQRQRRVVSDVPQTNGTSHAAGGHVRVTGHTNAAYAVVARGHVADCAVVNAAVRHRLVRGQRHGRERPAGVAELHLHHALRVQPREPVHAKRTRPLLHAPQLLPRSPVLGVRGICGYDVAEHVRRRGRLAGPAPERVAPPRCRELEHDHTAHLIAVRQLRAPLVLDVAARGFVAVCVAHVSEAGGRTRQPPDGQTQSEFAGRSTVEPEFAGRVGHAHHVKIRQRHYGH